MMLMDHTNHMAQSVCHSNPCSTVCGCFSELMQLLQNLNFFKIRYSNGCSFKARIMKLWQLNVRKSCQNHSLWWFFDLFSDCFDLTWWKSTKKMIFKAHLFGTLFLLQPVQSKTSLFWLIQQEPRRCYLSKTNDFWWLLGLFWGPLAINEDLLGLLDIFLVFREPFYANLKSNLNILVFRTNTVPVWASDT